MREPLDDIFNGDPKSLDQFLVKERGAKRMNTWKSAGILVLLGLVACGGYKAMGSMVYTQKDFADIATIAGEEEVMAYESRYCTPLNKRDRDIPTCLLWREKHRKLIVDGPDLPKEVAQAVEDQSSVNPTLGAGRVKGK